MMFFIDTPCYQDSNTALTWVASATLPESRFAALYYCPIAARDAWYGGKTIWGCSGAIAAACALGDANFVGATPGIHFSPAGQTRGKLNRQQIEFVFPEDVVDRDAFYDARVNPVVPGASLGAVVDDALTYWPEANYSRFIWVNRIANYIEYRFLEMATYIQHEPDGLTQAALHRGMKQILDDLVMSGAIVKPRGATTGEDASPYTFTVSQTAMDGGPYTFLVEQPEIDRWLVTWAFCPTGSARRIVGQPILLV